MALAGSTAYLLNQLANLYDSLGVTVGATAARALASQISTTGFTQNWVDTFYGLIVASKRYGLDDTELLAQLDLVETDSGFRPALRPGGDGGGGGGGGGEEPPPGGGGGGEEPPPPPPPIPEPKPIEDPFPEPEPFDYQGAARLIAPWLPPALINVFADAWAEFGDQTVAMAAVRADSRYNQYFPGNKRDDGTLRMTEQEYLSRMDAYSILLLEYGLNPGIFSSSFVDLIEGNVSASEFASRLQTAQTQLIDNFEQIRQVYSQFYGVGLTNEAIFASFIDEGLADAILNRRISVAQVAGSAAVQGFSLTQGFAERLVNAGLTQGQSLQLFGRGANQIPTLQRLATRFNDPDASVDATEFAEAEVFLNPGQVQRFRRLTAAESASFTPQGFSTQGQTGAVTGLSQR